MEQFNNIKDLDEYCRIHNEVIAPLRNQNGTIKWNIVTDYDEYAVGQSTKT